MQRYFENEAAKAFDTPACCKSGHRKSAQVFAYCIIINFLLPDKFIGFNIGLIVQMEGLTCITCGERDRVLATVSFNRVSAISTRRCSQHLPAFICQAGFHIKNVHILWRRPNRSYRPNRCPNRMSPTLFILQVQVLDRSSLQCLLHILKL